MRTLYIVTAIITLLMSTSAQALAPKIKHVTLEDFTTLEIALVPDLGTRFVFPFVLDEQDKYVPFTLTLTNPIFETKRLPGRNTFVVTAPPPPEGGAMPTYVANLFVSVAGHHLSVTLTTTNDLSKHVSDIVFDLTESAREDLIQQAVAQRIQSIEKQYQDKEAALDQKAEALMLRRLGQLAMSGPVRTRIREEQTVESSRGDRYILYMKDVESYGNVHLIHYEITNDGREPLRVSDAALFMMDDGGGERKLVSANTILPRIDPDEAGKGVIVTQSDQLLEGRHIKLAVLTDNGPLEVVW